MQIQQRVLRLAAAASVTAFMVVGAVGPVHAVDSTSDDETTTTRTDRESRASEKGKGKSRADHSDGNESTTGDSTEPQPESTADENDGGANAGDCDESTETTEDTTTSDETSETDSEDSTDEAHAYCSTRDGSPSENGVGDGEATGKPCAGCVGKADNKNPPGQAPDGSDANAGYECDRNEGIGKSNPAHTGCTTSDELGGTEQGCVAAAAADGEVAGEEAEMTEEECVPCPTDAEMGDQALGEEAAEECVAAGGGDEVLGAEAEAGANRPPAEVAAASSGILPETGAGQYALAVLAGMALLGVGGVLLLRKRPQTGR